MVLVLYEGLDDEGYGDDAVDGSSLFCLSLPPPLHLALPPSLPHQVEDALKDKIKYYILGFSSN